MMNIDEIREYMLEELKDQQTRYRNGEENKYGYVFMLCNDMGLIPTVKDYYKVIYTNAAGGAYTCIAQAASKADVVNYFAIEYDPDPAVFECAEWEFELARERGDRIVRIS